MTYQYDKNLPPEPENPRPVQSRIILKLGVLMHWSISCPALQHFHKFCWQVLLKIDPI